MCLKAVLLAMKDFSPTIHSPFTTAAVDMWQKFPTLAPCSTRALVLIMHALPTLAPAFIRAWCIIMVASLSILADFET